MDEGVKGMIIFGVALTASIAFLLYRRFSSFVGKDDLRPTATDPTAQSVAAALRSDQPGPLLALLSSVGPNWDARGYYLKHLVHHAKRPSLDAIVAQQPTPLAFLVRGCHAIQWAWQARGRGSSSTVSAQDWKTFEERIALAKQDLLYAAQGDPQDPTPHAYLIIVAKAQDAPDEVAWQHFSAAIARQPDHFLAHDAMLSKISRRWGGSDAAMFDFVQRRVAEAPPGSDLPMLLFEAHLDVWSYIVSFEHDTQRALQYLNQPAVRQELYDAYARSLGGQCNVRPTTIHYRNSAAFTFYLLQDVPRLRFELERIAGAYTEYPWVYNRIQDQETIDVVTTAKMVAGVR